MMSAVLRSVLLVVPMVLALGGCGDASSEDASSGDEAVSAPSRAPDLEGVVGEVTQGSAVSGDTDGSVLVEAEPGVEGTDKITFTVTSATALLREEGSGFVILTGLGDLVAGRRVRAWALDGRVAESYPGQAQAEAIVVVG